MHVESIMSKKIITVDVDDTLAKVKAIFDAQKFHHLLVLEENALVGIISDKDYLKAVGPGLGSSIESVQDRADLQKRVHQIMSENPKCTTADTSIEDVIRLFNSNRHPCLPVINDDHQPIGIISFKDVLKSFKSYDKGLSAQTLMSRRLVTLDMDDSLTKVKAIFDTENFHHLIVVEGNRMTGIISDRDYLRTLNPHFETALETTKDRPYLQKRAHQIMIRNPVSVTVNEKIKGIINLLNKKNIPCVPVVDKDNTPVGFISWRDILKIFVLEDPLNELEVDETVEATSKALDYVGLQANIKIQKLAHGKDIDLPLYASEQAAGADLRAAIDDDITLFPGEYKLIKTGVAIALPDGYEAQIRPRSGLAYKHGITVLNSPGTIDADYRGEIGVILINHGKEPFVIVRGERIAQMIIAPFVQARFQEVISLTETARGEGGFGSSGRK